MCEAISARSEQLQDRSDGGERGGALIALQWRVQKQISGVVLSASFPREECLKSGSNARRAKFVTVNQSLPIAETWLRCPVVIVPTREEKTLYNELALINLITVAPTVHVFRI